MLEQNLWQFMLDWEPETADMLAQKIAKEKSIGKIPNAHPKAVFTYGMPGSGKSHFTKQLDTTDKSVVGLSLDTIFQHCPHYEDVVMKPRLNCKWKSLSSSEFVMFGQTVMAYAVDRLRKDGYSLVLDGLGAKMLPDMYNYLKTANYQSEIIVAAVPKRVMDMNILTRFVTVRNGEDNHFSFSLARSPSVIKYYQNYLNSLQSPEVNMKIINPVNSSVLYDSQKAEKPNASEVFLKEFFRPLTKEETQLLERRAAVLHKQVEKLTDPIERRQCRNALRSSLQPYSAPENLFIR